MHQPVNLLLDCFRNCGMAMPQIANADTGGKIQILLAFAVPYIRPLPFHQNQFRGIGLHYIFLIPFGCLIIITIAHLQ